MFNNINKNIKRFSIAMVTLSLLSGCASSAPVKDGSPVVYESDFGQVSAKEYYGMMKQNQKLVLYARFEKDVLSSFKKDQSIIDTAKSRVDSMTATLKDEDKESMDIELRSMGYKGMDELQIFFENMIYRDRMSVDYVNQNMNEIYPTYAKEYLPRLVSHILVKVEDVDKPTKEEQEKLNSIRNRVLKGESFATVAKEVSDDTSKEQGGSLGLMDKTTNFVPTFLAAALSQKEGQIADWVKSEHGYHLILVDSTDPETIQKDSNLAMQIVQSEPKISVAVMNKIITDSKVEFLDETFEKEITEILEGGV